MEARPIVSPVTGAGIGVLSAVPFAGQVLGALGAMGDFALLIATACVVSGAITGATFGREVAANPSIGRILGAPILSVMIGVLVAVLIVAFVLGEDIPVLGYIAGGLVIYGLPAYFLALPAFAVGVAITRRVDPS